MFVFACGSGSEDTLERPSVSPPDETEDNTPPEEPEIPTPPESFEFYHRLTEKTITTSTRALYDAEKIAVFNTGSVTINNDTSFDYLLTNCMYTGFGYGYSFQEIGVLNGIGKEQGYTKDFLLNPDVERTFVDGSITGLNSESLSDDVDAEFDDPTRLNSTCNSKPCKKLLCGVIKGD